MNLPNRLTLIRVLLIPVFVIFMMLPAGSGPWRIVALVIFIAASLTDLADGYIARKYNMITDFGKFMDPLADKLLVCSALICLTTQEIWSVSAIPAWIVVVIIAREFTISGFRLIAAEKGIVIAASWWGKWKTTLQMFMVIFKIADIPVLRPAANILMIAALILTIISLIDYLYKNRGVMSGEM